MTFSFTIAETHIATGKVDQNDMPIIKTIKHKIRFVDTNKLLTDHLILALIICQHYLNTIVKIKVISKLNFHTMTLISFQNVNLV